MSWLDLARQRHQSFQRALVQSLPSISLPVGDSDYTAPGYLFYGQFFSVVPDPAYPWDPAVLRAIRDFCPDAMPLRIRSVWRYANYGEMGPEFVLTRHGLGRAIRNPKLPVHSFHCEMPIGPIPGLCIPGRNLSDCVPNYVEVDWFDKEDRPHGYDLPGEYLPFDWEFYYALRAGYEEKYDREGFASVYQKWAAPAASRKQRRERFRRDEGQYVDRDISRYYSQEPSDLEWKQRILGDAPNKDTSVSVSTPSTVFEGNQKNQGAATQ